MSQFWNDRFDTPHYVFGTAPNAFLASQAARLQPGWSALAVADGEGRNGVWLAEQGLTVHAVDVSPIALEKARRLAAFRGVTIATEEVDLLQWSFPVDTYDVVVGIFFQFAPPPERDRIIEGIRRAVKPGGLVMLEGYTPRQLAYRTGGPQNPAQLWTAELLAEWFAGWEIELLAEEERFLNEGTHHVGMSAVVDLVARRPV